MNKPITLSINPSYFCNFRCDFCYLTEQQLSDPKKISIERLDELLYQVTQHTEIGWIDLYGGEIGALKHDYFDGIRHTIRRYYSGKISIVTNLSMLHAEFFENDVVLSVSYDFEAREKSDRVFQNMLQSPVPIAVLILASPKVLAMDVSYMITVLNMCASVTSVEIKPYSTNQANNHGVTHRDFEQFVIQWIDSTVEKRFQFINEDKINACLDGEYNAFSDDHIYITPNGKFGVLEFDLNDREFFLELDSWDDYIKWTEKEKNTISSICKKCEYFGHCLTEHYRPVYDLTNSCNGYKGLLNWYARMEN